MAGKRHDQHEIEKKLQRAAKLLGNGEPIAAIAKKLEISKQTLFRWRREYGGLDDRLLAPRNKTRHSILNTAERLLAEEGMSVSLRRIMAEADVNIAAINYHFGSRQSLIEEIVQRRLGIVVEAQLQHLEEIEQRANVAHLEKIVHAFIGPPIEASLSSDAGWQNFSRFIVWLAFDPSMASQQYIEKVSNVVHPRFLKALRKTLPQLPDTDLFWRFESMLSLMQATLRGRDRLRAISGGTCGDEDFSATLALLTPVIVAMWKSPPARADVAYEAFGIADREVSES